eukprot:12268326-Heterocapsa_arctica.AAC.1
MQVFKLLKRTSSQIPIIVSLHQPRPEFDLIATHAMLMSGGTMRIFMPTEHFREAMFRPQRADMSPMDFALVLEERDVSDLAQACR